MFVHNAEIYEKMKNKTWLSIEKYYKKEKKMLYYSFEKLWLFRKSYSSWGWDSYVG